MPSSVIHGMRYVPQRKELDIVFRAGRGTYRYFDVDAAEWKAFKQAPSKGTYLNAVFKARHPRVVKVTAALSESVRSLQVSATAMLHDVPDENVWGFFETTF